MLSRTTTTSRATSPARSLKSRAYTASTTCSSGRWARQRSAQLRRSCRSRIDCHDPSPQNDPDRLHNLREHVPRSDLDDQTSPAVLVVQVGVVAVLPRPGQLGPHTQGDQDEPVDCPRRCGSCAVRSNRGTRGSCQADHDDADLHHRRRLRRYGHPVRLDRPEHRAQVRGGRPVTSAMKVLWAITNIHRALVFRGDISLRRRIDMAAKLWTITLVIVAAWGAFALANLAGIEVRYYNNHVVITQNDIVKLG